MKNSKIFKLRLLNYFKNGIMGFLKHHPGEFAVYVIQGCLCGITKIEAKVLPLTIFEVIIGTGMPSMNL